MSRFFFFLFLCFFVQHSKATTWDEPWQKEIIQKSKYFVYAKVLNADEKTLEIEVIKSIGGELSGKIIINGFFMLNLCSASSGNNPGFELFSGGDVGYFFLSKSEDDKYQLPTPTSGFAKIVNAEVYATYRHSYHQASVPIDVYELTYKEIWKYYHKGKPDLKLLQVFIEENLAKKPSGFKEDEIKTFFLQHVALETAYLLNMSLDFNMMKKFAESENYHSQISAIRVIGLRNDKLSKDYLLNFITSESTNNFAKVMAVWSIRDFKDSSLITKLIRKENEVSDEDTGFGGNLMDPRVCTYVPSPKSAIEELKQNR
jgi:hypothetical protein